MACGDTVCNGAVWGEEEGRQCRPNSERSMTISRGLEGRYLGCVCSLGVALRAPARAHPTLLVHLLWEVPGPCHRGLRTPH